MQVNIGVQTNIIQDSKKIFVTLLIFKFPKNHRNTKYSILYEVRNRIHYNTKSQEHNIKPIQSATESSFFLRIIQGTKSIVFKVL